MYITRYTDYYLRVLIYLAVNNGEQSKISSIATSYGISKNHLMKIVQQLNISGYLLATRGKNGGIKLIRPAKEINVGALVREMENKDKLVECFGDDNQCVITPSCQLQHIFAEAQESFFSTLDNYYLSDLIGDNKQHELAQLLAVKAL